MNLTFVESRSFTERLRALVDDERIVLFRTNYRGIPRKATSSKERAASEKCACDFLSEAKAVERV